MVVSDCAAGSLVFFLWKRLNCDNNGFDIGGLLCYTVFNDSGGVPALARAVSRRWKKDSHRNLLQQRERSGTI